VCRAGSRLVNHGADDSPRRLGLGYPPTLSCPPRSLLSWTAGAILSGSSVRCGHTLLSARGLSHPRRVPRTMSRFVETDLRRTPPKHRPTNRLASCLLLGREQTEWRSSGISPNPMRPTVCGPPTPPCPRSYAALRCRHLSCPLPRDLAGRCSIPRSLAPRRTVHKSTRVLCSGCRPRDSHSPS
jgi:hypothetical protein